MKVMNSQFPSIEQVANQYLKDSGSSRKVSQNGGQSFAEILEQKQLSEDSTVRFSKHATGRLNDRNIELSDNQLDRLNAGMQKASAKGINESLVLMDQLAFIVNVKNNTVITAMDQTEAEENVFTNIDGAVIV
ncbi:MAG: TIGR02530 family flagellar biosynthesis protein [Lachnospiraceae bacterium]